MKRIIKSSLSIVLVLTIVLSSSIAGLGKLDFSGLFAVKAKAADSGVCGENAVWTFSGDTMTISGTGVITHDPDMQKRLYYDTKTIVIEEGITGIGDYAFGKNWNLNSVLIPATVTTVGLNAFIESKNLKEIHITDLAAWCNIDFKNEKANPLIRADNLYLNGELVEGRVIIPAGAFRIASYALNCPNITSVVIPYGVTEICDFAFAHSENLVSVTIPDSVVTIGNSAFYYCKKLSEITIPDSVTTIGKSVFCNCYALKSVTLSKNITVIAEDTFSNCGSLETITIPDSVKSIDEFAFSYCTSLTNINFCEGLDSIGSCAFYNCISLTSVVLPDGMKSIGSSAFESCRNLNSITIPYSVTYIGVSSFYGSKYYFDISNWEQGFLYIDNHLVRVNSENTGDCEIRDGTKTIAGDAFSYCRKITSIKIPDSVVSIGDGAFEYCESIETITLPDSVTYLGRSAFKDCVNLSSVELSDSVTSIGSYAFSNCTSLETVTIPDSVTSISSYAFKGCTSLVSVTLPDTLTDIDKYVFEDSLYYDNGDNWENDVLYIGNHLIEAKTSLYGQYDIRDGTISIAASAFDNCAELISVKIPDSVTNIGETAFLDCIKLKSITIPGNVSTIGKYAFADCVDLVSVTVSDGVMSIGESAFKNCDLLYSITIPDSVTTIEDFALGYDNGTVQIKDFVVCGKPGTIAETYANENGFTFVDSAHTHISTDWKTIKESTVDIDGVKIKECTVCKTALETEIIPQLTPAAPMVSVRTSTRSISLRWKKVSGADEYIVYRREYEPEAKKWSGWTRLEDGLTESGDYDDVYYYDKNYDINHYDDYSAKSGTYYIYTVRAANEVGCGPYTSTEKLYFLEAPKITSLEHDCNNITIKWKKVDGTKAYIVYRANMHNYGNGWQKIDTTKGTSYVDKSAKVGEHYKYTVRSYNGSYISWFYDYNEITMLTSPKLKSVSCSKDGATVKWDKVKGADSYYVYRREYDAKAKKWSGWTRIGDIYNTSYVDKTAKSGTYYIYTIKAKAGAWNHSDYSSYDKTGLKLYFLATPSLKSATSTKSGVKLQWNKISGATGYIVYRKTGNGSWTKIATVKGSGKTVYLDKSAKKGITYTYTVRAYYGSSKSSYNAKGLSIKDKY
ncbi:MAG: leucine-rich repeat protein [Clostridia bacterium]|nr:leucine-rich repeat protein [Clostridia bacterium]